MIGRRALFGSAFALLAVGVAVSLSSSDRTTRSSDGSATASSTGKPGAVAAARSILDNALLAAGAAVAHSSSNRSTPAGANVVGAAPAEAGETRSTDGPAASPAGQPTAVATASSIAENDKLTTGTTGAGSSTQGLLSGADTGERRATRSVDPQVRPGAGLAQARTGAPPKAKREGHGPNAPRFVVRARSQKPAVSVAHSPRFAAQRQRDARPMAAPVASTPQLVHAVSPARVIDEAGFLR